jgi:hypothetical protein
MFPLDLAMLIRKSYIVALFFFLSGKKFVAFRGSRGEKPDKGENPNRVPNPVRVGEVGRGKE